MFPDQLDTSTDTKRLFRYIIYQVFIQTNLNQLYVFVSVYNGFPIPSDQSRYIK